MVIILFSTLASALLLERTNLKEVTLLLKKTLSLFLISRWLIAIFIISVVGVAVTPCAQEIPNTRILDGIIINKNMGLVTVGSNKHPGQIITLSSGPKTDLLALRAGDQIIIEYSRDYIIQAISKQS